MNHIDHEAELYALGMLDEAERANVDDHLATCEPCTVLVGQAEAAVAALIDSSQERRPQQRTWWPMAIAAAFAIAAAGLFGQNLVMRGALGSDGTILAAMVNSHFAHAQFQSPNGGEIPAKAIYERHGKWFEILADGAPEWHVVFVRPDGTRDPANADFVRRGPASIVFLAPTETVRTIDLEDTAGRIVGVVHPVVEAERE